MPWTDPRDWEGLQASGTEADRLGERTTNNRYSLNDQWRDNMLETCPAKAQAVGDIFVGTGENAIRRLAKPAERWALRATATDVEWVNTNDPATVYHTTAQHDLLQGGTGGAQEALHVIATGTKILTAHGAGVKLTWEEL